MAVGRIVNKEFEKALAVQNDALLIQNLQSYASLVRHAERPEGAADLFAKHLRNGSMKVVIAACESLGMIGAPAAAHVGAIAKLLMHQEESVRNGACITIGMIATRARPGSLQRHAPAVIRFAEAASMGEGIAIALKALGEMMAESQAEYISDFLTHASPCVNGAACFALGCFGSAGQPFAEGIAKHLETSAARHRALTALVALGSKAPDAYINEIIDYAMTDLDPVTRNLAVRVLSEKPDEVTAQPGALNKLAEYLRGDLHVSCAAATVLGYVGARHYTEDVAALLQDERDDRSWAPMQAGAVTLPVDAAARKPRCAALFALGRLGAKEYAEDVVELLDDADWEVRHAAVAHLKLLGCAAATPHLLVMARALRDDAQHVRAEACTALAELGAIEYIEEVVDRFTDASANVRATAVRALATFGEDAATEFAEDVFSLLNDRVLNVRIKAIDTLVDLRVYACVGVVAQLLAHSEEQLRIAALQALPRFGPRGTSFAGEVATCLEHKEPRVKIAAARTLTAMGADALPYGPQLKKALGDRSPEVQAASREAIKALGA
eukprot:NODE_2931_length_2119_cov_12.254016.p1 GENE.NODE_2931_length_2119_cov_12.254016~~NODE_2931_length_2119_cov_12.254016.p1  ORF type:complete len:555 (-),score=164.39 NODE_2931_length_2119_cov_12.254016:314-1978(-)